MGITIIASIIADVHPIGGMTFEAAWDAAARNQKPRLTKVNWPTTPMQRAQGCTSRICAWDLAGLIMAGLKPAGGVHTCQIRKLPARK